MMNDFLESEEFIGALNAHSNARTVPVKESIIREIKRMIRDKCSAGWQPIDTAPKDGEEILLYCPGNHPLQLMGFFSSDAGGRWEHCSESLYYEEQEIFPTHWMPLPDAPKD